MNFEPMLEQLADEKKRAEEELVKIQRAINSLEELQNTQEERGIVDSPLKTSAAFRSLQSQNAAE